MLRLLAQAGHDDQPVNGNRSIILPSLEMLSRMGGIKLWICPQWVRNRFCAVS